jgi:hypothetical protein
MTTSRTMQDTPETPALGQCWCCGSIDDPGHMVHLGNHPEVVLCRGCAQWAAKRAWEIDDRAKTGPLVLARNRLRNLRQVVIDRGWHRSRIVGGAVRWLGKRLP